jgi:hypothetical protein
MTNWRLVFHAKQRRILCDTNLEPLKPGTEIRPGVTFALTWRDCMPLLRRQITIIQQLGQQIFSNLKYSAIIEVE